MTPDDENDPGGIELSREEYARLRRRAERQVRKEGDPWDPAGPPLPIDEVRQVLHDLRVYQIELEMQNEELRRTQEELEASRERYFELYDLAPVAYLTLDETGIIREANLTAVTLLGEERSTLVDRPLTKFIFPTSQDAYYRHRRKLFETGVPETCELEMHRRDGTPFDGRVASTLAHAPGGEPVDRTVVSDITERKRAEAERRRFEHRLQQAEKADSLGRMAGAIAHHFNNLLGVTTGNLELAMSELPPGPVPDEQLSDALAAARSAAEVSGMLLTYVGQAHGEEGPVDLAEICRRSVPILQAAVPHGIEIESDLPTPGPSVNVSTGQVRQILRNLVTNAWEAVEPDRGTIRLAVRAVASGDVPVTNRYPRDWSPAEERYARLTVSDRGAGIDPRHIERIFDPFFSSKGFGRGLGLSVALGSVRAHGGAIVVGGGPDRGSTLDVYIPVATEAAAGSTADDIHVPPVPTEGTVLLVDDEAMIRSMGTRMLARMGLDVVTAEDGVAALEAFDTHRDRVMCVVCDLTMPRMNGWETLQALRARRSAMPIVLTSGFDEAHAMSADYRERPQVFLSKPWDIAGLRTAIQRAMAG